MATRFETGRLIIRDYELTDAEAAFDMYRRSEVHAHLLRQPAPSLDFMAERVAEYSREWRSKPYGFWAVEERDTARFVGSCVLKPLPMDERFEVGWHVHPDLQGRGFATEFGLGAIKYAFAELRLEAVYAILRPENKASKRVAEKIGMSSIGFTNRYHGLKLAMFEIRRDQGSCPIEEKLGAQSGPDAAQESLSRLASDLLEDLLVRFPLTRPVGLEFRPLRVSAGRASFDTNSIVLSSIVLRDFDSLKTTLLHEFAHLLAYDRAGRLGRGHGSAWKQAMNDLGQVPQVHHRYEVKRNRRRQTVVYQCRKCGSVFERHRRLPKRGTYVHARCGGPLALIGCLAHEKSPEGCEVA